MKKISVHNKGGKSWFKAVVSKMGVKLPLLGELGNSIVAYEENVKTRSNTVSIFSENLKSSFLF